jgi:hypothetical protein
MDLNKLTSKEVLLLFNELKKQPICVIYSFLSFSLPFVFVGLLMKLLKLKLIFVREVETKDADGKIIKNEEEITIDVDKFPKLARLSNGKFFL